MSQKKLNILIAIALGALWFAPPAFAYLDPGTGSILLQGLIAAIAGAAATARIYWYRIKSFFAGSKTGENSTREELKNQEEDDESHKG